MFDTSLPVFYGPYLRPVAARVHLGRVEAVFNVTCVAVARAVVDGDAGLPVPRRPAAYQAHVRQLGRVLGASGVAVRAVEHGRVGDEPRCAHRIGVVAAGTAGGAVEKIKSWLLQGPRSGSSGTCGPRSTRSS